MPGPAHAGFATGRDPPIGGWVSFPPPKEIVRVSGKGAFLPCSLCMLPDLDDLALTTHLEVCSVGKEAGLIGRE